MFHAAVATMTSKGQLTIPKAIRDALGLHEGDQVRFELDSTHAKAAMEPVKYRAEDLWNLAIPGAPRMSFEDMEAAKRAGARR
jgi:AbrB family looped-hinge helix DNA binding protein